MKALLALADGTVFHGESIGAQGQTVGEVVFNTSITGYQEILTDPSYCKQIVTLTYPHIGNVGVNQEDEESAVVHAGGLVVRDRSQCFSNWRASGSLSNYLVQHGIVAISDIDTRKLTRILREKGAQSGCIIAGNGLDEQTAILATRGFTGLQGMDLAQEVTTSEVYDWREGEWSLGSGHVEHPENGADYHVVAYDFGVKRNILRMLVQRGCRVSVVPAKTPASDVLRLEPDGVFLSNGPGDPEPCDYAIHAIQEILQTQIPVFGICLGHQLLALASGAKTVKMKFGHHGANHPVQELRSGKVVITSQNHGFAVEEKSLPVCLEATYRSLFDGSLQGIQRTDRPAFSFQGHPEASPGPHDMAFLFDRFVNDMAKARA